jgi:hypothetical protein
MILKSTTMITLGLAFGVGAMSLLAPAQDQHASARKTYTSPDGEFQFQYPDWFIDCAEQSGEESWSCASYMPICSGTRTSTGATPVCVAYPRKRVGEGNNFGGAAFVVDKFKDAHDESTCLNITEAEGTKSHIERINGASFTVAETDGVAMGHSLDGKIYRAFRNQTCYELDINIAAFNPEYYDPPRPKYFNQAPVRKALQQVLATFKFLK